MNLTSMSVLLIVVPNCTLAASHAAPGESRLVFAARSVRVRKKRRDKHTDRRTDGRTADRYSRGEHNKKQKKQHISQICINIFTCATFSSEILLVNLFECVLY